jgi:NitT/TauT family transport system ATP-binding protein
VNLALVAEGISHVYHTRQGGLLALDGVGLSVAKAEFVAIVGPSGCGKSTLLRILGGLLTPTEGWVHLDSRPLSSPRRQVGYVFQKMSLMPWRTVLGNVVLPLQVAGVSRLQAERRALDLVDLVGLTGFEAAYPRQLSGGMAQRVAIARALVSDPEVLLLDEPFGSLDALSREQMNLDLLRIWQARRVTAVMVTHDLQEAIFLSDRVLVMSPRPGRICAQVAVSLPRPRKLEVIYSRAFGELSHQVREAISSRVAEA